MKLLKLIALSLSFIWASAYAQNISIATGGTGGVYYPMGGGLAAMLSSKVPGMSVTAEVTGGLTLPSLWLMPPKMHQWVTINLKTSQSIYGPC